MMNPVNRPELERLIHRADVDELIRCVDALGERREWELMFELRNLAREARTSGRQVWPVATLCEYRIALRAPATWVGRVLADHTGQSPFGPLTEVAAQHHTWRDLCDAIPPGPDSAFIAYERMLRGDLDPILDERADASVLELPFRLWDWEPRYALAEYHDGKADFPMPEVAPPVDEVDLPPAGEPIGDPHTVEAFRELVGPWTSSSNGRCDVVTVEGDHLAAIAALGVTRARVRRIEPAEAVALMAWAGASGGAHGRRRGAAYGRFAAWWATAAVAGLAEEWPIRASEMGDVVGFLRWYVWDAYEPAMGWQIRLAVHDREEELGLAIAAIDHA